jgi:outer membrane protein
VKKLYVCLAAAALVAGTWFPAEVRAQDKPATTAAATPHQVGLIDMAHVFKEYEKFKALSEALRAEVETSEAQAKAALQELQQLQAQLTGGTLKEGTPEFTAIEQKIVQGSTELETFRKVKQREFLRKEADVYRTVYLEVQSAVEKYARYYKYTLVMRFNRGDVESAENPQEILQSMNRPVVYHRGEDDLTDPILNFLNNEYRKTAGTTAPATTPAATAPATNGTR